MTEQELENALDYFKKEVDKKDLTGSKIKKINFFSATKMLSLETKHSAFFAWLLDPSNEHCLNNAVLVKLLEKIYKYNTKPDKLTAKPRTNVEILLDNRNNTEISVATEQQLIDLANSSKIIVTTEKKTDNGKRMDIFIDIVDTETVIVIENKIGSSTHDDQLREYEKYINSEYSTYKKKIFVYLTKSGELPYDTDAQGKSSDPNDEWCAIDYGAMCDIIEELIDELNKNDKQKFYQIDIKEQETLKQILEQYIFMVKTNILNTNPDARQKCKELLSDPKFKEAYEILKAYERIPTPEQIADYVCEQLGGEREGTSSKAWFYTKPMKDYFINKKEEYNIGKLRCVCQCADTKKEESKITIYVDTSDEKNKPKCFSQAQIDLLTRCNKSTSGSDVRLISKFELVSEKERGMEFDELKPTLDSRIAGFKKMLDKFTTDYLI